MAPSDLTYDAQADARTRDADKSVTERVSTVSWILEHTALRQASNPTVTEESTRLDLFKAVSGVHKK